ncbi:MAG: DEDD exonuclease domain-containing protein [Actinomycetes bacterium]
MSDQLTLNDLGRPLQDTTFIVVDLETTGGSPTTSAITEIGAVKVQAGEVLGEFRTFVNPGGPIPVFITVLTGITDSMVALAPSIGSALPAFLEFCNNADNAVLVAHNAPFDIGFLKAACAQLKIEWPHFETLDTAKLARTILGKDEVKDCKLGTLAPFFGAETTPNHRALDDARATVDVLHGLISRLGNIGVTTLPDLKAFSHRVTPAQKKKKYLAEDIPATCGVYIFKDIKGVPLYVGVSNNLRNRVRSYFTASEQRRRIIDMIAIAESVETIVCRTPLEASVLELRLIEEFQPRINRRSKQQSKSHWIHLTRERFPRLAIARGIEKINDNWIGPFTSRSQAQLAIEAVYEVLPLRQCTPRITPASQQKSSACALAGMGKCGAPCIGDQSTEDYEAIVDVVRNLFAIDASLIVGKANERMKELALEERYEEAIEVRNRLTAFLRGGSRGERLRAFVDLPQILTALATDAGGWEFTCIRYGRFAGALISDPGYSPQLTIDSLLVLSERVEPRDRILPASSHEEAERLLRYLDTPGMRLVEVQGEWIGQTRGSQAHRHAIEALALPAESIDSAKGIERASRRGSDGRPITIPSRIALRDLAGNSEDIEWKLSPENKPRD